MAKKKAIPLKIEIDPADITTVENEPPKEKNFKYAAPYWSNKERKHIVVTLEYNDGRRATASVQDMDGTNPDYKAILKNLERKFSIKIQKKVLEEEMKVLKRDSKEKKQRQFVPNKNNYSVLSYKHLK